ncbi:hypothetical protein [Homoserinibacter sp. YIM 151385]|uniref:hypothetical protein n=1 Tax=Homoserinibacter sp. YIM 151385 TaxID=2985506 RepID=UPI0022F06133|nr:hypothetical protein [Homoserinibacter sp. YIM 151385]WBU38586.1 hypothetical protein OF852_03080 [Homoserinibacter sp. YIM 151385]
MIGFGETRIRCSASACESEAAWGINWRNPRIHGPERVKVWLACDAHREHLAGYLSSRGFPVVVAPLGETVELVPDGAVP